MRLALFDLDHTLLPIDSADTWSHFVVDKGGLDAVTYGARIREFSRTYHAGTFDIEGYVAFQMKLLSLFPRATLDTWHRQFMDQHVRPHIRREALQLVDSHRRLGDELALVTGTNAYVVTPIAREFGIEHVLAVEPEVASDGANGDRFTGGYVGTHTYQTGKVRKVGEWLAARGRSWDDTTTICYGDSINDLALLERATIPIATNADARLRAIARERGWQTLELFAPSLAPAT